MTPAELEIYATMPPAAQRAIDACSNALKPIAIRAWAAREFDRVRKVPPGYVPWDKRPASRALIDREPEDDSDERYP
jgi:hypothetical protein